MNSELRRRLQAEARRRGLGVSPTLRTLAVERLAEVEEERELGRARAWQLQRALDVLDAIERGEVEESSWDEIDALFDKALARAKRRSGAEGR